MKPTHFEVTILFDKTTLPSKPTLCILQYILFKCSNLDQSRADQIIFPRPSTTPPQDTMSLCTHCNAIDIDKLVSNSHSNDDEPHHRTFSELKRSAESCPLCALFVEGLEKKDPEHYLHLWADKPVEYRGKYANWLNERTDFRTNKLENSFLTGLWIMCEGCSFLLDIYVNEGQSLSFEFLAQGRLTYHSYIQIMQSRLLRNFLEDRSDRRRILG